MATRTRSSNLLVDILRKTSNRREKELHVFQSILAEIEDRVRRRLDEGGTTLAFEFPLVKPGLPTYDIDACASYVEKRLHARGLDTRREGGRLLHVSWERLLRLARRRRAAEAIRLRRRRRAAREAARRERRARREGATAGGTGASGGGPPVPPHADDPDDLFSLPSVRGVRSLADTLRSMQ